MNFDGKSGKFGFIQTTSLLLAMEGNLNGKRNGNMRGEMRKREGSRREEDLVITVR